jgi:hypothetical protein
MMKSMIYLQELCLFRLFGFSCFRDGIDLYDLPRISILSLLIPLLAGCGGRPEPVRAYGQPIDHWLAELQKPDSRARKKAVVALGQIGAAEQKAIPALIGALKDQDAAVKEKAILALLHIGPAAREAIPALTEAQSDPDPNVQAQAKKALEKIRSEP